MKRVLAQGLIAMTLSGLMTIGEARQLPHSIATDARIKRVVYQDNNVVDLETTYGYATTIELQQDEYILGNSGSGKESGWEITSPPYANVLTIKPKKLNNTTNLNFVTNKGRRYTLLLTASEEAKHPTFRLQFIYRDKGGINQETAKQSPLIAVDSPAFSHQSYSFSGDKTIAPIKARDDGEFTVLQFKPGAPLPAILAVDLNTREESLINYRVQSGCLIIEGVYPQYTLRLGSHVTCLFNDEAIRAVQQGL